MADHPPRRDSTAFPPVVADPAAPSGPLHSNDIEALLNEFGRQTAIIIQDRLRGLPDEVGRIVQDVFMECLRDVTPDRVSLVSEYVEARVRAMLENSDRAELGGRAVKLRMHRPALWFAERYRMGGMNARIEPGDQDRPTVRMTPSGGTEKR